MFGRSSNAAKAMNDVQRIKLQGGTANLSFSQIVCLICNAPDAQRNLTQEEFGRFRLVFDNFRKMTKCATVDFEGYLDMCRVIIGTFEKYFPYLLVDGEHSENLELRNQIKIRKLYADGYKFEDALLKYENEFDSIPPYSDYDPVKDPRAKLVFTEMVGFMSDFVIKYLFSKATISDFGILSGVADAVFLVNGERYLKDLNTTENAVTIYTMLSFAINGYSDAQIDSIMKKRRDIAAKYYQEFRSLPNDQMFHALSQDLVAEFIETNPEINEWAVKKSLSDYNQNIMKSFLNMDLIR